VSHDGFIATGSRDKSVKVWNSKQGDREYNLDKTLVGHTNFVGTVAWIPPGESLPAGGLVSGGMDTRVLVWDLENASIAKDLKGHKLQVSNVAVDSNGDILSASVDRYFSLMLFLLRFAFSTFPAETCLPPFYVSAFLWDLPALFLFFLQLIFRSLPPPTFVLRFGRLVAHS
jgi:WD40 repeat protein